MFVDCRTFTKYVHYLTIVVGFQGQPGLVCWSEHIVKRIFSLIMTGKLLSTLHSFIFFMSFYRQLWCQDQLAGLTLNLHWEPDRLNSTWLSGCHHDEPTKAEGEFKDIVAQSSAINNINSMARWRSSCGKTLNCLIIKLFRYRVVGLSYESVTIMFTGKEFKLTLLLVDLLKSLKI